MEDIIRLINTMRAFSERIAQFIDAVDHVKATFKPDSKEWSIVEILGHLIDIDELYSTRINTMLEEDNPALAAFEPDAVVAAKQYQSADIKQLLQTYLERRQLTIDGLSTLAPDELVRMAQHAKFGGVSVLQLIEILANHDEVHWQQILNNVTSLEQQSA